MNENRVLITAPEDDVLSVDDCKTMLGISGADQDAMIEAVIDAVVGTLDPASDGSLGRALATQTWELQLDRFPMGSHWEDHFIHLPFPPLISIASLNYDDNQGVEQTLIEDIDFEVLNLEGRGKQYLAPVHGKCWPFARHYPASVRVRFEAGYAEDDIPAAIKSAVALGVRSVMSNASQNLYLSSQNVEGIEERTWVVSAAATAAIQGAIDSLLAPYKVW